MDDVWVNSLSALFVGLLTAGSAILGVHLSNKHNAKVTSVQRREDQLEAERLRIISYKKEIYFSTVEQMTHIINVFHRLSDVDFDDKQFVESIAGPSTGLNKVYLTAGPALLSASTEGAKVLCDATIIAITRRLVIKILQSKVKNADAKFNELVNLLESSKAEFQHILQAASSKEERQEVIDERQGIVDEMKSVQEDCSGLRDELQGEVWSLQKECMEAGLTLTGRLNLIIVEMRKEIDLELPIEQFVAGLGSLGEHTLTAHKVMIDEVKQIVERMGARPY